MEAKEKLASLLFTEDWQSYICFQAGVYWRSRGDRRQAQELFLRALRQDHNNRAALLNLGILYAEAKHYEWALLRLDEARRAANDTGSPETGPVWYKATYQIAATYLYGGNSTEADREVNKLLEKIYKTLGIENPAERSGPQEPSAPSTETEGEVSRPRGASNPTKEADKALKDFLRSILPLARLLWAGIQLEQDEVGQAEAVVSSVEKNGGLSYRTRYNLACFYSRRGEAEQEETRKKDAYDKALTNLQYALELDEGILGQWASDDPALRGLREDNKTLVRGGKSAKDVFDELRAMYASPIKPKATDSLPLAGVRIIGETYATQLKERGILTEDDLILKADTASAQRALADTLGINANLVSRWALLMDLMRIVGIDTQHANLLEAAEVQSLRDLKDSDPDELAKQLHQLNQAQHIVTTPPSEDSVRRWVYEAKETVPMVSDTRRHRWLGFFRRIYEA
jgi:tetratricopeptide (TPR) repeat protein